MPELKPVSYLEFNPEKEQKQEIEEYLLFPFKIPKTYESFQGYGGIYEDEFEDKYRHDSAGFLVLGDSLEVLKTLQDDTFSACITDPPFGIGFRYNGKIEKHSSPKTYGPWIKAIFNEIVRVVEPGGFIAIAQHERYYPYFRYWFRHKDVVPNPPRLYYHIRNFSQTLPVMSRYVTPVVCCWKKGDKPMIPTEHPELLDKKRNSKNFYIARTNPRTKTIWQKEHPCPMTVDAIKNLVQNFTTDLFIDDEVGSPNGTILDPFSGSGSVSICCIENKRKFFAIEKDKKFFSLSYCSISNAYEVKFGLAHTGNLALRKKAVEEKWFDEYTILRESEKETMEIQQKDLLGMSAEELKKLATMAIKQKAIAEKAEKNEGANKDKIAKILPLIHGLESMKLSVDLPAIEIETVLEKIQTVANDITTIIKAKKAAAGKRMDFETKKNIILGIFKPGEVLIMKDIKKKIGDQAKVSAADMDKVVTTGELQSKKANAKEWKEKGGKGIAGKFFSLSKTKK